MPMSPRLMRPSGRVWTPPDVSGLYAWWDISDASTVTLNGNGISYVDDKSGNGRDLLNNIGAEQPTYAEGQNGKYAAHMNGSQQLLTDYTATAGNWDFLHYGTDKWAMFLVAQRTNTDYYQFLWAITTAVYLSPIYAGIEIGSLSHDPAIDTSGEYSAVINSQTAVDNATGSDVIVVPNVNSAVGLGVLGDPLSSTQSIKMHHHGGIASSPVQNGSADSASNSGMLSLGGYDDGGFFFPQWEGWIGEVFLYRRVTQITDDDRQSALAYLKKKWALT